MELVWGIKADEKIILGHVKFEISNRPLDLSCKLESH